MSRLPAGPVYGFVAGIDNINITALGYLFV
jgi:hypothetical protein